MDTLLSQFCKDFDANLRPILTPLEGAAHAAAGAEEGMPGKELLPQLLDLGLQFRALVDKVAEQQAYVLIFGPLKSGKSTLMNSVCAAYVSEVTSLPAYPCMVYVSHSESLRFIVTRYNGETQHFTDPTALRMEINRAHGDLADRIREVETRGDEFDPAVHFSKAIRRVDVKVPAGELEQSGAVLVDTPGLYARMKFGYDQMTRDFRNAAACAIFVVKSDNLFLEQVFEEFSRLLELFSRIFLVVNLDTGKRDLKPDGSLTASLEREDPLRIIEAFQNLAMSARLKDAADEGRLRIYPVDLLHSASRRILEKKGREAEQPQHEGEANFETFLGDLTDYLNSTEYLVAFLSDSLRRATNLLSEVGELLEHGAVRALDERVGMLQRDFGLATARHEALGRLVEFDWKGAFGDLQRDLEALTRDWAREVEQVTTKTLEAELETWFLTDESLQRLIDERLTRVLVAHRERLGERLFAALSERVGRGAAGVVLPDNIVEDLRAARVHLDELGKQTLQPLDTAALGAGVTRPIEAGEIPVKKALFWDWLLFRSRAVVRRRLFGPEEHPALPVPPAVKDKRLGQGAAEALREALAAHRARFFPDTVRELCARTLGDYAQSAARVVAEQLASERSAQSEALSALEGRLAEHRRVLECLRELGAQVERSTAQIGRLSSEYAAAEPIKLMQPYRPIPVEVVGQADPDDAAEPTKIEERERAES
jgi:hypothetical protein